MTENNINNFEWLANQYQLEIKIELENIKSSNARIEFYTSKLQEVFLIIESKKGE